MTSWIISSTNKAGAQITAVETHLAGKGGKSVSKRFGLPQSTDINIVVKLRKFKTGLALSRIDHPQKDRSNSKQCHSL